MNDKNMSILKKAKMKLIIKLSITYAIGVYFLIDCFYTLHTNIYPPTYILMLRTPVGPIIALTIISVIVCTSFFLIKNFRKLKKQIETEALITAKQKNNWFVMIAIILIGTVCFCIAGFYSSIPNSDFVLFGDPSRSDYYSHFLPETYLQLDGLETIDKATKIHDVYNEYVYDAYRQTFTTTKGKQLYYSTLTLYSEDSVTAKKLFKAGKTNIREVFNETKNTIFGKNKKGLYYYCYEDGLFASVEIIADAETLSKATNETTLPNLQKILEETKKKVTNWPTLHTER